MNETQSMTSFVFCVPEDSRNWDATHDPPFSEARRAGQQRQGQVRRTDRQARGQPSAEPLSHPAVRQAPHIPPSKTQQSQ